MRTFNSSPKKPAPSHPWRIDKARIAERRPVRHKYPNYDPDAISAQRKREEWK